jgi:hypothetical protein
MVSGTDKTSGSLNVKFNCSNSDVSFWDFQFNVWECWVGPEGCNVADVWQ